MARPNGQRRAQRRGILNKSTNVVVRQPWQRLPIAGFACDFVISRSVRTDYVPFPSSKPVCGGKSSAMGMIPDDHILKIGLVSACSFVALAPAKRRPTSSSSATTSWISCGLGLERRQAGPLRPEGPMPTSSTSKRLEYFPAARSPCADPGQQRNHQRPDRRRLQEAPHLRGRFELFVRRHRDRERLTPIRFSAPAPRAVWGQRQQCAKSARLHHQLVRAEGSDKPPNASTCRFSE